MEIFKTSESIQSAATHHPDAELRHLLSDRIESLSDLLDECAEAHDNLKELKKNSLPDFYKKWHKNFNDKNHHVKNISDPTDIRIYDRFWNTYTAEKEHIIKSIEIELEHADNQCSYIKLKPEINANQPKIENWSDSPK